MGIGKLKVVLTEEAQAFLDAQPFKAQQKIYYNIFKVEEGVMKVNIFKKLENTDIWEFRTLYNGISYRLFSFWDTELDTLVIGIESSHRAFMTSALLLILLDAGSSTSVWQSCGAKTL